MTEWGTIQTYSNWCYIDCLVPDGVKLTRDNYKEYLLQEEQEVEVRWPSGKVANAALFLKRGTKPVPDHGHTYDAPDDRAYLRIDVQGARAPLYLRGQERIKLRRVTNEQ